MKYKMNFNWTTSCIVIGSLFMALFYQKAWIYPVTDSFPLIERILDPHFLVNDFFTNSSAAYSPRMHLVVIIASASHFFGVNYTDLIAWANILRIVLYAIALYRFYFSLARNSKQAFIAFYLSVISFLTIPQVFAWWPVSFDFTASNFAGLFALIGWTLIVRRKVARAFLLFTVAIYFHPLVGLHACLIGFILILSIHGLSEFLILLKQPFIYVAGSLLSGVFLNEYLNYPKALNDAQFIKINAQFGHAIHFFLSHIKNGIIIFASVCMIAFMYLIFILRKKNIGNPVSLPFLLYAFVLILVNLVFVELYPTRFAVSFIPLRAFPPILSPLFLLCFSSYMESKLSKNQFVIFGLLHLPFLPYHAVGLTWYAFPHSSKYLLPALVFMVCFALAIFSDVWPKATLKIDRLIKPLFDRFSLSQIIFPFLVAGLVLALLRFNINIPNIDHEVPIYKWLKNNTEKKSIIVSELNAANNQKVRLLARRAVVVSKDFPFNENDYLEWYERYSSLYKNIHSARGHIDTLDSSTLNFLLDKYKANILLRTKELDRSIFFKELARVQGEKGMVIIYENINIDGVAKSPPYGVTVFFQDLDIPYVCLRS